MTTANSSVDLRRRARALAAEVSAFWPGLDHGDGTLYTIAREALDEDLDVTASRVAEIAREAEADAALER
jgi:hypothetical protein